MRPPTVSVVIPTVDRPESLERALDSVLTQAVDNDLSYEVVVVDNARAAAAATEAVVDAAQARTAIPIRYVHERRRGVAHARNCGVTSAAASWIAFCDDDQIADPRWLTHLVVTARIRRAQCVGGAIELQLPSGSGALTPVARRLLGEQPFTGPPHVCDGREIPSTGSLLAARNVFDAIGMFDWDMHVGGEDAEWVRRAIARGTRVIVAPAAIVRHVIPAHRTTTEYLTWVAERSGSQLAYIDWKHHGTRRMLVQCALRVAHSGRFVVRGALAAIRQSAADEIDAALCLRRVRGYLTQTWWLLRRRRGRALFRNELDMDRERTHFSESRIPGSNPL